MPTVRARTQRREVLEERRIVSWWGGKGTEPGSSTNHHSIAIDSDGRLLRRRRRNKRVQVFDQKGKFSQAVEHLSTTWGVFVKGDRLYVVDGTDANWPADRQHEGRQDPAAHRRAQQSDCCNGRANHAILHRRGEWSEREEARSQSLVVTLSSNY